MCARVLGAPSAGPRLSGPWNSDWSQAATVPSEEVAIDWRDSSARFLVSNTTVSFHDAVLLGANQSVARINQLQTTCFEFPGKWKLFETVVISLLMDFPSSHRVI
jgi:hypothetical protein